MTRTEFLQNLEVKDFINYLAESWYVSKELDIGKNKFSSIQDAFQKYEWGFNIEKEPIEVKSKRAGKSFDESQAVLNELKEKIKNSYTDSNESELHLACRAILKWGGVLGSETRGNLNYLIGSEKHYYRSASEILSNVKQHWDKLSVDLITSNTPVPFRSNAGFTKIYSIFFDDFVIYDSRVGASFAFFLLAKFGNEVPEILRISIPIGRTSKNASKFKRNPNPQIFRTISKDDTRHFSSNVKVSWILMEVINTLNQNSKQNHHVTLRQLEAALFMIGYDVSSLSHANTQNHLI